MCKIYIGADPILYESRTRALRIHGVVTTVRLENLFWDVLQEIANRENLTTTQFAVKLYDELLALRGEEPINFASFLRVCCLRYLSTSAARTEAAGDAPQGKGFQPKVVKAG
ncbi:ribbon-helix-helix domain-containing protein [Paraburkholderia acidisoli]|uniref:Aryl-sulfate sulfotransferase n=1 Tax=Paraburkholderia acidisoli TaxID=2571748 RepID=A0A7Z2JGN5_9BURK|nr:ribbon-helix-helix domain-containing protein [Paraburkholderia acidisoli]QGZ64822.1 aryl-sulfate sulfotransferase [Paraburkholderia acidisoli]